VWQALRQELHPRGLEVVTVALDTGGSDAARQWIEAAKPEHPSVIDPSHLVDELLGVVNVPNGLWIDEEGMIVRPAEPAWIEQLPGLDVGTKVGAQISKMRIEPQRYREMIYDWVEHGSASQYVLPPHQVIARSQPRSSDSAGAAAHFDIGQYLHRAGDHDAAVGHFREAHRLQPENWTYKRQAWNLETAYTVDRIEAYGTGWLDDVQKLGAENYYPEIIP
jgi:hypothetical protein